MESAGNSCDTHVMF